MALVDTVDPTDINLALQHGIGAQLRRQLPQAELERRLDAYAYAAAEPSDAASRYRNRPHGTDTRTR